MIRTGVITIAALCAVTLACASDAPQALRIIGEERQFVVNTPSGPLTITRHSTACASDKGYLQPLVPLKGVRPVTELEVLEALNDVNTMVIDMRDEDEPLDATIPNSFHIPYNEIEDRLDELGCVKTASKRWSCAKAKKIVAFCYGPMCLQSPAGIRSMVRAGFPVSKIAYYRGGLMDWEALGLSTVTGSRPTRNNLF
jgi:rhodanese-related sulfurtransferase